MATTNPQLGSDLKIYIGGTAITNLRSHGVELTRDTVDVTTKDSSNKEEVRPTISRATMSFDAIRSENATYGYEDLLTAWNNGTAVQVEETNAVTGHQTLLATAYVTSLSKTAPYEGEVSFSGTLQITGGITAGIDT
jgi:TP901-1 family phage major tail protein